MLKRTISSAVVALLFLAAILLNEVSPYITVGFFALVSGMATHEMLYSTGIVKNHIVAGLSCLTSALIVFLLAFAAGYVFIVSVAFVMGVAIVSIVMHNLADIKFIFSLLAAALILPFGFMSIYSAFAHYGTEYLLLIINFSAVNDAFAYLVGVSLGRHKLCPEISPKKTVEGAIGGILGSLFTTCFIVHVIYSGSAAELIKCLVLTPIMCTVGTIGDLFASLIKRNVGIKDYGKLIPGHGGIMDRFDSIILIAPVFIAFLGVLK